MSIPTNLYSDKILSEHPLAMWSLDDNSDYVSLISEPFRNLNAWTISAGSSKSAEALSTTAPFPTSFITKIIGSSTPGTTTLTSNLTFSSDADGFTVGFYIQSTTDVTVRVRFSGGLNQQIVVYGSKYPTLTWIPVSFTVPTQATNKTLQIDLVYTSSSPEFFINGLTIGKNSEPFNGESFGQSLITLPTTISTTQTKGIESKSYGNQKHSAYYIGSGNNLYAKNAGMSMSYGSSNSAIIYPHATEGEPSFIFPGLGLLNESGRYKQLTLEMLIRINADNLSPKKIIGPLASSDGVYVNKDFISLKIGDFIDSFYLSELYRPMLLQLKIAENSAVLSIDGDDVISLPIQTSSLILPGLLDESSKSQDWLGIFAYTDVPFIEVDSIAIYPYRASGVLSKMRLAYAQAVDVPLSTNIKFGGNSVLFDYGFANYTNNYNYPSFQAKWEQASIIDNLDVSNTQTLSTRTYTTPELQTSLYSSALWLKDVYETNNSSTYKFITLRPTSVVSGSGRSWSSNQGYLNISSFNRNEHLSNCIYGVFKSLESSATEQILIQITNESSQDYLRISLTSTTVSYKIKYGGTVSTITTKSITQGTEFAVGIDIKTLATLNSDVSLFLSNINDLDIYVGGNSTTANTFSGNIYKVGLCSPRNFSQISGLFASGVINAGSSYTTLLPLTATYTVAPKNEYESTILDIATNSYWQDYIPLNKLSKIVDDDAVVPEPIEDLDFVQINIDYPEPKTYLSGNFDTSNSELKSYITFQRLNSGAIKDLSEFDDTVLANSNRVIDASTPVETSKYEFVNGMVVYPPRPEITGLDWGRWAIVLHIELNNSSSNLTQYEIRSLQVAAKTLEYTEVNPIGTRHGTNLYPYKYLNNTYNYKDKNPHILYKQATPYLYLTRHSGVRVSGDYDSDIDRGVFFEVGNATLDISINSMQMSILADIEQFPDLETPLKIFEIDSKNGKISFYVKKLNSDNTKGVIYTDYTENLPIYYLNGKIVANPVIELGEWNVLGLSFLNSIDLSESVAKIKITSSVLLNNVSVYGLDSENNSQKVISLTWDDIDNGNWNALGTWKYSSISDFYKVYDNGMKEIYATYTGTNKIYADTTSNTKELQFNGYKYIGYMDIEKNVVNIDIA